MRHLTGGGIALIKRFEGFAPEIYICPGGWPTIGYGHVVRDHERDRFANGIDEAEAGDVNGGGNMYRRGGAKMYHGLGGSLSA